VRALAELDVLVLDCQATGASPAFGHVLELGWGIQRAGESTLSGPVAHWILLPEGHRVPPQVRKLTGYEPCFAAEAIADSEAWRRLRADSGAGPAVPTAIHYARFELSFLREWAQRFEPGPPFPLDAICLHAVARRLYPDLPRQSIRALAGYLGFSLELARRSLGHVEATGFVWRKFREELGARGVGTWDELHAFLAERPTPSQKSVSRGRRKYPLAPERYRSLPDAPGVYRFLRSNGDVLYVGKAASLRKRVASHFGGRGATPQAPEMLTQVGDIGFTVVPSALEAALLENESIKTLRPPYNVQLIAKDLPVWYETPAFEGALAVPDARHSLGPLSSELSLRPLAALVALLDGAPVTETLRSQSVGVSALFTPDEAVFAAGWSLFAERHAPELGSARPPRRRAFELARKLLGAGVAPELESATDAEEPGAASETSAWDPPRVARHLERALVQAYRAHRRAHWLRLLHDSDIVYREPAAKRERLLKVRGGAVVALEDAPSAHATGERLRPLGSRERPAFDRAKYERLRVLTTELKRIVRDGGSVAVHWGPGRTLPARWLTGALGAT
jgi:DNA polymerase III subunit epsilon